MLGAGTGVADRRPVIAALRSVDPRWRWPQHGETSIPQVITVTSEPGPNPEALPHAAFCGLRVVTTRQATHPLPLPSRGYRQIYSRALIGPLIEDYLALSGQTLRHTDGVCRHPWVRCLALCLPATTGGRQPFPITRHPSHPTSRRLPMAGKLRSRITSIASQQEDGVLTVRLLPELRPGTSPDPHFCRSGVVACHWMWPLLPFSPLI